MKGYTIEVGPSHDYSYAYYRLFKEGEIQHTWTVQYGYNTPEWQQQEKLDRARLKRELETMGLDLEQLLTERLNTIED